MTAPVNGIAPPRAGSILTASPDMARRNRAEARFRSYGVIAIAISLSVLAFMLITIFSDGISSFRQAKLAFPVTLDAGVLDPKGNGNRDEMSKVTTVGYGKVLAKSSSGKDSV